MGTRREGSGRRARRLAPALAAGLLWGLAGCTNEGDTVNVNGLDCGLIRDDLFGDWNVSFTQAVRTLQNCDEASANGSQVNVAAGTTNFTNVQVQASPSSTSFQVSGEGPVGLPNELIANVEADSCLALVQVWEDDEGGWLQCIGTADLVNRFLNVVCDSFDLDTDLDGFPDNACGLNGSITGTVGIP